MIVLSITTSAASGGVALVQNDTVLAEIAHVDPRGHAEHLFDLIDRAFTKANVTRGDVQLIAVDIGPGSFTGARIGVAAAKGIALGLGVHMIGVVSLAAMAARLRSEFPSQPFFAAAIDARKNELYLSIEDQEGAVRTPPCHIAYTSIAEHITPVIGNTSCVSIVDTAEHRAFAAPFASTALVEPPSPSWIAKLGAAQFLSLNNADRAALDPGNVVPLYVRPPDAVPLPAFAP
ncbi:MAG: tRNA (adenosine(37)-N6)-threonylcarbamoyltransferase complex dimerization subunit type 1 TsaB [Polyangiaceae bacterium]|nr:tRNA (adenosine(37)-N6)-threonylcarbamoyltransferase complex dimerization subunit type 1 TsaB [Polyangiaceae bacterium]